MKFVVGAITNGRKPWGDYSPERDPAPNDNKGSWCFCSNCSWQAWEENLRWDGKTNHGSSYCPECANLAVMLDDATSQEIEACKIKPPLTKAQCLLLAAASGLPLKRRKP